MNVTPFTCKRGELTIRGHLYRCAEGKLPPVILCHGFVADERTNRVYAEELAKQGYAAYTFDFCGGGRRTKSDGLTSEMTVFTEIEDLRAVMDYVKQQPDADADRLTLQSGRRGVRHDGEALSGRDLEAGAVLSRAVHPRRRPCRQDALRPL